MLENSSEKQIAETALTKQFLQKENMSFKHIT